MADKIAGLFFRIFRSAGRISLNISDSAFRYMNRSKLLVDGPERNLYRTQSGDLYWLNPQKYLDKCIIEGGVFEPQSTSVVHRLIKPGDTVLDVGANIGYYSVLFSKLVGEAGKVVCFEPTTYYHDVLAVNLSENNCSNVLTYRIGLSNKEEDVDICIGDCSASLYFLDNQMPLAKERIHLQSLDKQMKHLPIDRLDFIKIDIDGHEPHFLEGAWETIDKYDPAILLEVSHQHYLKAGINAGDFFDLLKNKRFKIFSEHDLSEIEFKDDFLVKCGNFAYSSNIVISRKELV